MVRFQVLDSRNGGPQQRNDVRSTVHWIYTGSEMPVH